MLLTLVLKWLVRIIKYNSFCEIYNHIYFKDAVKKAKIISSNYQKHLLKTTIDFIKGEIFLIPEQSVPKRMKLPETKTYNTAFYSNDEDDFVFSQEIDKSINLSQSSVNDSSLDRHTAADVQQGTSSSNLTQSTSVLKINIDENYTSVNIKKELLSDDDDDKNISLPLF